jgi:hypothetical protein
MHHNRFKIINNTLSRVSYISVKDLTLLSLIYNKALLRRSWVQILKWPVLASSPCLIIIELMMKRVFSSVGIV